MAFGGTGPWLPRRSSDYDVNFAMTLLPPLLLLLGALAASSAAPMSASAAPAWRAPPPGRAPGAAAHGGGGGGGPASTVLGASLGGGLGAGIGGRTLGELAESELDRYAFLMLDPASSGSDPMPAGTVTRRITPKSVFIAPNINGDRDQCAEGYQQDDMGRCVKVVKVDAEKSWDLLLDKLNNQFADLPFPLLTETTTPPGPPPGPFQLAIPIAGLPDVAAPDVAAPDAPTPDGPAPEGPVPDGPSTPEPAKPESPFAEQSTPEQATEVATEVEEEAASTTPSPSDEDTETPAPTPAAPEDIRDALIPEVVMLTSEEQPHVVPAPAAQVGAYLVNGGATSTTEAAPSRPVRPASNQSGNGDVNPIINTVNNSPLVTGESMVQEVPPISNPNSNPNRLVAEASSLQQLLAAALGMKLTFSSSTIAPETAELAMSSSTTVAPVRDSTASPSSELPVPVSSTTDATLSSSSNAEVHEELVSPSSLSPVTSGLELLSSSTATSTSTPPVSTTSEPFSSTTSTASWSSSDESRPSSSNLLRPSLLPVIPHDLHAVRFPTERPSSPLRFPAIDVTFPTSRGGVGGSGGDANRLPVDKPVVFPKDVYWPPLASAPYWSLEQTRTRPQQQQQLSRMQHNRFWQSRPSHALGFGGPNTLSTSAGTSLSSSFSPSSSSSSSSSSSQEGSQIRRRTHYRAGSGSLHTHRSSPTHRRGREY
ncbi:uncharacterized protein LOC113202064 [Frankliniella occidentalis]|uniref:Uncharacterized protein LOC113202064 n=1 Tax=Frankliniella occidentalis TaxID=133901 RepID=A0A6J1RSN1_FRAOC|nr:uncharacterized protein LOC113202064 [Frankliniella occidentalis]